MTGCALVTGADGFVGRVLCDHLGNQGWRVRQAHYGGSHDDQTTADCDISDRAQVRRLIEWAGPVTHVFHLAAVTSAAEANEDPAGACETNLIGTIYLAEALREKAPSARLIFVSTSEVYGTPVSLPVTETHPLNPSHPYAISKAAADLYCGFLYTSAGADIVRMRSFNHSGPGQSRRFVLPSLAQQVAEIEASRVPPKLRVGNLDAARDFTHVKDVVRAYELAALYGAPGQAYNVCSGKAWTIREAVDILTRLSGARFELQVDAERLRSVDVSESYGSFDKLHALTGWRPQIAFEALLADLLDHARRQLADNG